VTENAVHVMKLALGEAEEAYVAPMPSPQPMPPKKRKKRKKSAEKKVD